MKTTKLLTLAAAAPVHLKDGGDAEAATQLRTYLHDAEDGLRRVLICGAYLDFLVEKLPHGTLEKWVCQHVPELSFRTVRAWRQLYQGVLESVGAKRQHAAAISGGAVALLAERVEDLPEDARELRAKIDAQIAGKTARQLFLQFRSADEDEEGNLRVKVGRRNGEGGRAPDPVEPRALSAVKARRAEQAIAKAAKQFEWMGLEFGHLPEDKLEMFAAWLEVWHRAVNHWLKTPRAQRGEKTALQCGRILNLNR